MCGGGWDQSRGRGVSLLVGHEVPPIRESFAAVTTFERLFPRVDTHVPLDRRLLGELLVADAAGKGLLTCVCPHVDLDPLLVCKAFGADLTGKGSLPGVGPHVSSQ